MLNGLEAFSFNLTFITPFVQTRRKTSTCVKSQHVKHRQMPSGYKENYPVLTVEIFLYNVTHLSHSR